MILEQVLKELNLTPYKLAIKAKVMPKTIYDILKGGDVRLKTAVKFNKAGIIVTLKDGEIIWGLENK